MDLFSTTSVTGEDTGGNVEFDPMAPLAVRMRPKSLDEVVGQKHLLGKSSVLRTLIETDNVNVSSLILFGPAGCGKTTFAYLIANNSSRDFVELSAVTSGVKEVREVISEAKSKLINTRRQTVLFIDEIHRFSKSQQDALLPAVENQWVILVAATTENPYFSINSPLISRSIVLNLKAHDDEDIRDLLTRALNDSRGFSGEIKAHPKALDTIVSLAVGDCRKALTILEASAVKVLDSNDLLTEEVVLDACNMASVKYDIGQHYDVVSAFIKSIRGCNVDAALFYLACMIEGGEDIKFICRRIMISAVEDIGLADPNALTVAVNACVACEKVGFPEGRIILAEAVSYLALAPKSNSVYKAIDEAVCDVRKGKGKVVPMHLRDAHYKGAASLGAGVGYKYPHDYPNNFVLQEYLPQDLVGREYYLPSNNGAEKNFGNIVAKLRKIFKNKL